MTQITIPLERRVAALTRYEREIEKKLLPELDEENRLRRKATEKKRIKEEGSAELFKCYLKSKKTALDLGLREEDFERCLQEVIEETAETVKPSLAGRIYSAVRDLGDSEDVISVISTIGVIGGGVVGFLGADYLTDTFHLPWFVDIICYGVGIAASAITVPTGVMVAALGVDSLVYPRIEKKEQAHDAGRLVGYLKKTRDSLYRFEEVSGKRIDFEEAIKRTVDKKSKEDQQKEIEQGRIRQYEAARDEVLDLLGSHGYVRKEVLPIYEEIYREKPMRRFDAKVITQRVLDHIEELEKKAAEELYSQRYIERELKIDKEVL